MVHWAPDLTRVLCSLYPGTAELPTFSHSLVSIFPSGNPQSNSQLPDLAVPQLGLARSKVPKKASSHTSVCSTSPRGLLKLLQIRPEGKGFALCLFKVSHEGRR